MTCPYDNPECNGQSGLYYGQLCCYNCYRDANESSIQMYEEWLIAGGIDA